VTHPSVASAPPPTASSGSAADSPGELVAKTLRETQASESTLPRQTHSARCVYEGHAQTITRPSVEHDASDLPPGA